MKRPHHMTMSELLELPVIANANELSRLGDHGQSAFGGAFTDPNGYMWRTLLTDRGWARYPACLVLLVGAQCAGSRRSDQVVPPAHPRRAMLAAVLRAFG